MADLVVFISIEAFVDAKILRNWLYILTHILIMQLLSCKLHAVKSDIQYDFHLHNVDSK